MELIVNDLSFHGQFSDLSTFRGAINRLMKIRQITQRFGRELHCHRDVANARVTPTLSMPGAIRALAEAERRALMQWLTRQGPFWEDARVHGRDDYLECGGDIVTDHAVGEAAFCCLRGIERHLVSMDPSSWTSSPVAVTWVTESGAGKTVEVLNHWQSDSVRAALRSAPAPLASWQDLAKTATARCRSLTFSPDCFEPLLGHPFALGAAQRILIRLRTLEQLRSRVDQDGQRTPEGQRLYENHFTGDKAWFSDSSETEKQKFRAKLTFRHPAKKSELLFCPWHGKVKTPQLRIHFTWPVSATETLYVVYVGPKITKR